MLDISHFDEGLWTFDVFKKEVLSNVGTTVGPRTQSTVRTARPDMQ